MASAKLLKRQTATCATLAMQNDDGECRQRYVGLGHLHLAEMWALIVVPITAPTSESESAV